MKMSKLFLKRLTVPVLALLLLVFPFLGFSDYVVRIAIMCMLYIILSASLNLISGVTGQVSMGHAAFFGIGAYASALLAIKLGMPVILSIVVATAITAVFGFLVGLPSLKLSGGYFAIVTLSFAEAIRLILINWYALTRGNVGMVGIPRPKLFDFVINTYPRFYFFILIFTILCVIVNARIINSKYGTDLKAIKNDEIAAEACGINLYRTKVIAFTVSALFAGMSGALYAHFMAYIDPSIANSTKSTLILCMVVLGGMGSLPGSVIAAIVLTVLPELLREFNAWNQLIYGVILVAAMLMKTTSIDWKSLLGKKHMNPAAPADER